MGLAPGRYRLPSASSVQGHHCLLIELKLCKVITCITGMLFYSLYVQLQSFSFTVICAVYFVYLFSFTVLCVDCVFYCLLPSGVLNK